MSNINCFLKSTLVSTIKGDLSFKELYDLQETGKSLPKVLTSFTHDNFELIEILEVLKLEADPLIKITFENNSFIKISNTNTIYTVDGLIKLDNLDLDVTLIGVPNNLKIIGIDSIQSKESHLYSLKLNNHNYLIKTNTKTDNESYLLVNSQYEEVEILDE